MVYIYTALVIIIILVVISTIIRKRTYKEVDRLEDWKNDIMNRPITEEIGKVKQLQMSGQTEEKFEEWRSEWDDIVGTIIPNIGEQLFDIEDHAVKNRFKKANQLIISADQRLKGIEEQLTQMLSDIDQLVQSEEQNRTEIDEVRAIYKQLFTELLKKRGVLGQGYSLFEEQLEKVNHLLSSFDQATIDGSYLQARDHLIEANSLLKDTESLLERYPTLLVQVTSTIPADIEQLRDGINEMEDVGYQLEVFGFTERIELLQDELIQIRDNLNELNCDEVDRCLTKLTEQVEQMYETLEIEVESKHYVTNELPILTELVEQVDEQIHTLLRETIQVQKSYYISKEQLNAQAKMRDNSLELSNQLHFLADVSLNDKQTFTSIREMIEKWIEGMSKLKNEVEQDKNSLYTLREEEWKAKETLRMLRDKLIETKRLIQKSNIPGLPKRSLMQLELAENKLSEASTQLDQIPLELGRVAVLVGEATAVVVENEEVIKETIELATLAEQIIQFGNRYRSRSHDVEAGLLEAEQYFRQCEYGEAIECAEQVIKVYEPNVMEKMNEYIKV